MLSSIIKNSPPFSVLNANGTSDFPAGPHRAIRSAFPASHESSPCSLGGTSEEDRADPGCCAWRYHRSLLRGTTRELSHLCIRHGPQPELLSGGDISSSRGSSQHALLLRLRGNSGTPHESAGLLLQPGWQLQQSRCWLRSLWQDHPGCQGGVP